MVKSLEKTIEKWKRNVANATGYYLDGVESPDKDWQATSLAGKARYDAEIQKSISEGRREKGISRAGTAKWKTKTMAKSSRWSEGVNAAEEEARAGLGPVLSFETTLQSKINAMPNATLADRKARAAAWIDGMALYKKR